MHINKYSYDNTRYFQATHNKKNYNTDDYTMIKLTFFSVIEKITLRKHRNTFDNKINLAEFAIEFFSCHFCRQNR